MFVKIRHDITLQYMPDNAQPSKRDLNMRSILITILVCTISGFIYTNPVKAQASIAGTITDADTQKPLSDAHVFLSGTKIGTSTNDTGQFKLQKIPAGGYQLVISSIGYKRTKVEVIISPGEDKTIDFKLKPVVYEMPEVYVGNLDEQWEDDLEDFIDLFIGMSEFADSVQILNPEVLRFDKNWWGKFTAEALGPLKIENKAMGYNITYYLEEFEYTGSQTRWDGEPLFVEMTPNDSQQARYWQQNRRKAFFGSVRHFLLALLDNRVKEEGFNMFLEINNRFNFHSNDFRPVKAKRLIRESEQDYLHHVSFLSRLEIVYTRAKENSRFLRWSRETRRPPKLQTSYIKLNERPITVDANGEILEPYGATLFGYFAFTRLASLTPQEFRPEGYPSLTNQER